MKPVGPRGDGRKELARLIEEHEKSVSQTINRLVGSRLLPDLDDLVQQVFVIAIDHWQRTPRHILSERAWLFGIAVKVVDKARRRAKVRDLFALRQPTDAEWARSPHETLEAKETLETLRHVPAQMAERPRQVWILAELQSLSATEVAAILSTSANNARKQIFRARKLFKAILQRIETAAPQKAKREK